MIYNFRKIYFVTYLVLFFSIQTNATKYYCDPLNGNSTNIGSSSSPWSTLESVFSAGKHFSAGDTIILKSGYHGSPVVSGINNNFVSILAESGAKPTMKNLLFINAKYWDISGFDISPQYANPAEYKFNMDIVGIKESASYIKVRNCNIFTVADISNWSQIDWETKSETGINCNAPYCMLDNNHIYNVSMGIQIAQKGTYTIASNNLVENICDDGTRGLANYCKFEYNTVQNMYVANNNHDDLFQSWSGGTAEKPVVGSDTVVGIEIRGNKFIAHTNAKQPLMTYPQGIGCFDGFAKDWIIENNLISVEDYHGITLLGAINCKIMNNTIVQNPYTLDVIRIPAITISKHKTRGFSKGNLIRNNLTPKLTIDEGAGLEDHNMILLGYRSSFVDYLKLDLHLKPKSKALKAGSEQDTPTIDIDKNTRIAPYSIGCYQ